MMKRSLTLALVLLLGPAARAGWEEDRDRLVTAEPGAERDRLLGEIVKAAPGGKAVSARLSNLHFPATKSGAQVLLETTRCTDGKERPYAIVVPDGYDPSRPKGVMVRARGP